MNDCSLLRDEDGVMGRKASVVPADFKGQEGGLVILVKAAVKLPNRDLLGESDPFVELDFEGLLLLL